MWAVGAPVPMYAQGEDGGVLIVHGTRAFRDRVPGPAAAQGDGSTTVLGSWYASVLRWRRPAALLVNEVTLLPAVLPMAPARRLLDRLPDAVAELLDAHGVPAPVVEAERARMTECRVAPTANRSVVGVLSEFGALAGIEPTERDDLLRLSLRLARTPCGPLYRRHVSPDRELAALVAGLPGGGTSPGG